MVIRFALILVIFLLLDWYFYQAVVSVTQTYSNAAKNLIRNFYWGFTLFSTVVVIAAIAIGPLNVPKFFRVYVFAFIVVIEISRFLVFFQHQKLVKEVKFRE